MTSRCEGGLGDLLAGAARTRGDAVAIVEGSRAITFDAYAAWVAVVAEQLTSLGVEPGDRVAMLLPNAPELCIAVLGAVEIGAMAVLVNPQYADDELSYVLEDSDPRAVVVPGGAWSKRSRTGLAEVCRARAGIGAILAVAPDPPERESDPRVIAFAPAPPRGLPHRSGRSRRGAGADPAIVIYTSGTTGRPKGAVLTHDNLLASVSGYAERLDIREHDRLSVFTPMCHAGGLINGMCTAVRAACTMVIADRPRAEDALDILESAGVTVYLAVPTMLVRQLHELRRRPRSFRALRAIVTGGAPVRPELAREASEAFGAGALHVVYGLSEANMATLTGPRDLASATETIVGTPTGEFELKIRGPRGDELSPRSHGEILLRGPGVFSGYWGDPASSADCLDPEGWLRTGDVGYLTAQGDLVISGRLKDMYIQGGTNIYPAEIERVLELHPDVAIAAVVGRPDPVLGEVGCAFVVPHKGKTVAPGAVLAHAERLLAKFKLPRDICVRTDLPLTAFGKVKKAELRAEAAERARSSSAAKGGRGHAGG